MRRTREKTQVERVRFAKMLDELKADGITQKDFAIAVGVTQSLVSLLKNVNTAMSISLAKDIERAFPKYRAAWLLGLDDRHGLDERQLSKVDALKVLNPIVSCLSTERRDALLEYVKDFIEFEVRKERG